MWPLALTRRRLGKMGLAIALSFNIRPGEVIVSRTISMIAYLYMRGIFLLLVAALSLGLSLAGAPPEFPSTPAGKVVAGYLEALNSGNKDKLEVFIKAHR